MRTLHPFSRAGSIGLPVLFFVVLCAASLSAQTPPDHASDRPSRIHFGAAVALAQPVGGFGEHVSLGGGGLGHVRLALDDRGLFSLRMTGGFLIYGHERQRVCLGTTVGCRIEVNLTTSNNIFVFGVAPEIGVPVGRTRLYGNVALGTGYFFTTSSVRGDLQDAPFATTRNFSDGGIAWTSGGGLEILLRKRPRGTFSLDIGVSHQRNGRREYLTRGDIIDLPDGGLAFDVKRSDANFLMWRVGLTVGLPRRP
jgi:hypothetical protein